MKNLDFIGLYKKKIIEILTKNQDVIKLIDPVLDDNLEIEDILLGGTFVVDGKRKKYQGYIFDFDFISDTISEAKTFIEIECYIVKTEANMFNNFILEIKVISHKNSIRLDKFTSPTSSEMNDKGVYSNRVDGLCTVIDKLLNGKNDMGVGNLNPVTNGYNVVYPLSNNNYYAKSLAYMVKNCNESGDICEN